MCRRGFQSKPVGAWAIAGQNRTGMKKLTWTAVTARRMARNSLIEPAVGVALDQAASGMCGVHAQVISAAELSLGRRIRGATRSDVDRAIWEEHTLVKTFGPRGTVHLLATADLPMWTGALTALSSGVPKHPDSVRFTPQQADEVIAAIADALADAELTVDELTGAIEIRLGSWAVERTMDAFQDKWPRWRQLTSTAAHRGVLCFGRNRGRNVTYTSPQRWLPGFRPATAETALEELVTRYLHAYGPATPRHFAKWLAIPTTPAVDLFDRMGDRLEKVDLDGMTSSVNTGDTATPEQPPIGVHLLPYFDAYAVAAQPREWLFPGKAANRALSPSGQAGNFPVLLVDGVVGGVWHQKRSGRKLQITVEPLASLTARHRRQLADEVELVGSVTETHASMTVGEVTVGPHA